MKTVGLLIGLWLGWGTWKAEAQQFNSDSIRRAVIKTATRKDSLLPDSLRARIVGVDTLKTVPSTSLAAKHSPRKAALYSLALPGLGQAYNKQYWKIPFVYVGLGVVAYFLRENNRKYGDFLEPYIASYDAKTGKLLPSVDVKKVSVYVRSQDTFRDLSLEQITKAKDTYRRWREGTMLLAVGIWALNAIEANVSAHLKTFDMSDDISLRIQPDLLFNPMVGGVFGVRAVLTMK